MIRLCMIILLVSVLVCPVLGTDREKNSTLDYTVKEYALISFDEASISDNPGENISSASPGDESLVNQTRRGSNMSARKLFQLKQAAEQDYQVLRNVTGDQTLGFSATKAQSVAIVCKQCVPQKTGTT